MVEIQNLTAAYVDAPFVRRVVQGTFQNLRVSKTTDVSVVFIGTALMRKLNAAYHHENRTTDVLSFPSNPAFAVPEPGGRKYAGEIVICASVIRKEALAERVPYSRALAHVLIHGTLHLFGYEHEKNDALARMHAKEERIWQMILSQA